MSTALQQSPGALRELPPPPYWAVDLETPPSKALSKSLPDPPGYSSLSNKPKQRGEKSNKDAPVARKPPTPEEMDILKLKKSWEVAIAPAKALPMSAIGMYMTGNSLQIFSIFMLWQLFRNPLVALTNVNNAFRQFEPKAEDKRGQMWLVKLVYVLTNLLAVGLGVWKVKQMGLLPTTRSDWLAWESAREPLERSYPAWGNSRWKPS